MKYVSLVVVLAASVLIESSVAANPVEKLINIFFGAKDEQNPNNSKLGNFKPTFELIKKKGYPVERHKIKTEDGFLLETHRIPHGIKNAGLKRRPVIYLQHGLMGASSDWIMNSPDKALGYILADSGYDVWLGNARGNTYSRQHESLSPKNKNFWDFSFTEIGKYDLPATIDYILEHTGQSRLYYGGHSMGASAFFALMHFQPEYNDKISGMIALAPAGYLSHVGGSTKIMRDIFPVIEKFATKLGIGEVLQCSKLFLPETIDSCPLAIFLEPDFLQGPGLLPQQLSGDISGLNLNRINKDYFPIIIDSYPAGSSARSGLHYLQNGYRDRFAEYDFGLFENLKRYGKLRAPDFDLSKTKVPVAAFHSDSDLLSSPKDVRRLLSQLPNLVIDHRVSDPNFTHLDFIWANEAKELLFPHILEALSAIGKMK